MSSICVLFLIIRPIVFSSRLCGNGFTRAEDVIEWVLFDVEFDVSLFPMLASEIPIERFWFINVNHTRN